METHADFVTRRQAEGVGYKTAIMEHAVIRRGLPYHRHNRYIIVAETPRGTHLPFHMMNGPSSSLVGRSICDRKHVARMHLEDAGLSVPTTQTFRSREMDKAWDFAQTLAGPCVVKPVSLSKGRGVTTGIRTREQFEAAWAGVRKAQGSTAGQRLVMVEAHITGRDYRLFVVGDRMVAASQRKRPNVTGDGVHSIAELIAEKNVTRVQSPILHPYPIPTDPAALDTLVHDGIPVDHVPADGEEVLLCGTSNLSGGGDSVDLTDEIHDGFRELGLRALQAIPGMEYLGIDVIAPSLQEAPDPQTCAVTEVEFSPGPVSNFPVVGEPRDMGQAILEHYLQDGRW